MKEVIVEGMYYFYGRGTGSKYDQDVAQPTYPQENSSVRQHLNNSKVGRGYQPRSHLSNNDTSEIGDSYIRK